MRNGRVSGIRGPSFYFYDTSSDYEAGIETAGRLRFVIGGVFSDFSLYWSNV